MFRGGLIAFLLSTMPFAALTSAAGDRAERSFHDFGVVLGGGVSFVAGAASGTAQNVLPDPSDSEAPRDLSSMSVERTAPANPKGRRRTAVGELTVHVGEARLLELARARVVPTGQSVPARAPRPAGIALHGVSALGVGLKEGDVLTAVEGRPVQAEGQVVGVVIGVLMRHARKITGEFWRGSQHGSIVVDLPLVELGALNER